MRFVQLSRFNLIVNLLCCNKCHQRSGIKPRQVKTTWLICRSFMELMRLIALD